MKVDLESRRDGKVSLTLAANGDDIIRIPDSNVTPYAAGSQRARAWQVVSLMDGLTVREGNDILAKLEFGIQKANGRPLGWITDSVSLGYAEIHRGRRSPPKSGKVCPAPGCGKEFQGNGWDGIDAHWKSLHSNILPYPILWEIVRNVEANAQPARQRTIVVHKCEQCGEKFSGITNAKFCSDKCRYDAANERRRLD